MDFINAEPKSKGLYLAEKEQIKKEIGELEDVRQALGLSRRKVCQLLLVDPSSWTKWTRPGQDAPAYIYRSLQWALAILEKYPETHPLALQLLKERAGKMDHIAEKLESKLQLHKSILFDLDMKVEKAQKDREVLLKENAKMKKLSLILALGFLLMAIFLIFKTN